MNITLISIGPRKKGTWKMRQNGRQSGQTDRGSGAADAGAHE
ncbi:hypothetical protein [Megasphaera sp.]